MATTKINCLYCNEEVYIQNKEIRRGHGKFCNRTCAQRHRVSMMPPLEDNVKCALCNKSFHLALSKQKVSKSGLYFCCRAHKDKAQRIGGIREIMPPHYGDTLQNYRTIAFKINGKERKCERCSYDEHEAAIVVHHIDHNRQNNDISNLEVLCANCHAIEHWGEVDEG